MGSGFGAVIEVEGLAQLERALATLSVDVQRELKQGLIEGAEPVRARAEPLAREKIRNMTVPWSEMRVGASGAVVYLAPKKRGLKKGPKRRPNLVGLLLDRAMIPAAVAEESRVQAAVERAVDRAVRRAGF